MRRNLLVPESSVGDISVSLDFYIKGVGFRIPPSREGPLFAYLELNGTQLMLEEDRSEVWFAGRIRVSRGRGMDLQIEVSDVGAARSRLAMLGVRPFRDLQQIWYETGTQGASLEGQEEFAIQSPDVYLIRLVEVLQAPGQQLLCWTISNPRDLMRAPWRRRRRKILPGKRQSHSLNMPVRRIQGCGGPPSTVH